MKVHGTKPDWSLETNCVARARLRCGVASMADVLRRSLLQDKRAGEEREGTAGASADSDKSEQPKRTRPRHDASPRSCGLASPETAGHGSSKCTGSCVQVMRHLRLPAQRIASSAPRVGKRAQANFSCLPNERLLHTHLHAPCI
eukprot:6198772-Pleurochrysis_carterae.AAC.4